MPQTISSESETESERSSLQDHPLTRLPFPPITRQHIMHCSYHFWHPKYRTITPKARLIPLPDAFINYLKSDGIVLPPETNDSQNSSTDADSGIFSASTSPAVSDSEEDEDEDEDEDPSLAWYETHRRIKETIAELKGSVHPKLNWSAPKDATWIAATNSMDCRSPNDIYLLLKSSDFITHDLEQAFDGCVESTTNNDPPGHNKPELSPASIPYHLILRKTIPALIPSLEFRCFVRARRLLCICQRDLNHYRFLPELTPRLRSLTQTFFTKYLRTTFPDENFVFDVYIPPPYEKVWLMDINPWAPRTDPLLFSWLEILSLEKSDREVSESQNRVDSDGVKVFEGEEVEFRLVQRDDPEAYSFNTPQYSAHKLPKDVVDASGGGEAGLREFMGRWRDIVEGQERGRGREGEGEDGGQEREWEREDDGDG